MYYYGCDINMTSDGDLTVTVTQDRTVEALTTALLDAQEQHRQDAATIDYLISRTLVDDDPKVGGTDE